MKWATAAAAALFAALSVPACTPPPPSHAPIVVAGDEAVDPAPSAEPAAARTRTPFATFLKEFRADYLESPQAVERHVSPSLGLFLLNNPGAFQRATFHGSFRELVAQADDWARLPTEMECGSASRPWVEVNGGFPKYSCELERYQTKEPCSMGTLSSDELREVIRLSGEYELETPEAVATLTQRAVELEPRITHYAFDTENDLGLMFGEVDGAWRLLFVRKISPCSA